MKLAIDVRGFSEEKKKRVQDAFRALGVKVDDRLNLDATIYSTVDDGGEVEKFLMYRRYGRLNKNQLPHATTYKRLMELAGMDTSDPDAPQATNAPELIATHHSQEITLQEAIDATAALNEQYGEDAIHEHLQRLLDLQWERLTRCDSAL